MLNDFVTLIVGWGLGLLSAPITDTMRRRSVKKRITRTVRSELIALQDSFALVVVKVARHRGVLTHSLLEALMSTLKTSGHTLGAGKAFKAIDDLLHGEGGMLPSPPLEPRGSLSLKIQGVPFLESHLHRMDFYSPEIQRQLLEIHAGAEIFRQYADEAVRYHFMTFEEDIGKDHHAALVANVEKCYERAAEKASEVVSQVAAILQSRELRA